MALALCSPQSSVAKRLPIEGYGHSFDIGTPVGKPLSAEENAGGRENEGHGAALKIPGYHHFSIEL